MSIINPELYHLIKGENSVIEKDIKTFERSDNPLRITVISDTHTRHRKIEDEVLPGGDLILHGGDLMNSGYSYGEIEDFLDWYGNLKQYRSRVFIAGNHDRRFENNPEEVRALYSKYDVIYLEDKKHIYVNEDQTQGTFIYGSPWQPEFYQWAFNMPRNGEDLREKWFWIPDKTEILITHGPPQGHLDTSGSPYNQPDLGCELLRERVDILKPKIHMFGHIHGSYGYKFHNGTHFINASVLNEKYEYINRPITFDWYPVSNKLEFYE